MALADTAPVVQKAYDLSLWLIPKVERFPRSHRFTVGDRVTNTALDLLSALVDAAYSTKRDAPLERALTELNRLRFLVRLAKDLKLPEIDGYGHASERIEEIGRMAGGWRKASAVK